MPPFRNLRLNSHYFLWRLSHPLSSFAEFYVAKQRAMLLRKGEHETLGPNPSPKDGTETLSGLLRQGLAPHHRVADFGCGTLRSGRHLISFLDPGNYTGLDVTDTFFLEGLASLEPDLVRAKAPRLLVLSRRTLKLLSSAPFDFILVEGVLQCVPTRHIGRLLRQLAIISDAKTYIYMTLLEGPHNMQLTKTSFRHSYSSFRSAAATNGFVAERLFEGLEAEALSRGILALQGFLDLPDRPVNRNAQEAYFLADDIIKSRGLIPEALNLLGTQELARLRGSVVRLKRAAL